MSIQYRSEIDGLRALAVLSVAIYHAEIFISGRQILSGGFLGVDIFFVISGFLITSIILKQAKAGKFSFLDFYDRRIRRILPAFITISIASTIAGYYLLGTDALKELSGSILSAMGSVSNIFFWMEDSYVAEPSKLKPFLHTWSLAVEEQFYLFFPILFLIIARRFTKSATFIVFAILLISFGYSVYASRVFPDAAFYLIFSRIWELGAGSFMAFLKYTQDIDEKTGPGHRLANIAPKIGLGLILLSIIFLNDKMLHPSELTLPAVVGTALIIWYANSNEITTKIFQLRFLVFIGLLSYSFYLWHWPVLVFAKFQEFVTLPSIVWVLISFILAAVSYYGIEKPLRYGRKLWAYLFVIFSFFGLIAFHTASVATNGFPDRFGAFSVNIKKQQNDERKLRATAIRVNQCHLRNADRIIADDCNQISGTKPNVIIAGDSLAADLYPALATAYSNTNIIQFTGAGCSFPKELPHCRALWRQISEFVETHSSEIDYFLLHARSQNFSHENFNSINQVIDKVPFVFIAPRHEIEPNPKDELEKLSLTDDAKFNQKLLKETFRLNRYQNRRDGLNDLAISFDFKVIDINNLVYPNGQFKIFKPNNDLNFLDYGHWSAEYGQTVGRRLKRAHPTIESLVESE